MTFCFSCCRALLPGGEADLRDLAPFYPRAPAAKLSHMREVVRTGFISMADPGMVADGLTLSCLSRKKKRDNTDLSVT